MTIYEADFDSDEQPLLEHDDDATEADFEDALREQAEALSTDYEADEKLAWVAQVRVLELAILDRPLPGPTVRDYVQTHYRVEYFPLPANPGGAYLRNLYGEAAHRDAQRKANCVDPNNAWIAGQYLHHRNAALGRFCYNTACLRKIAEEGRRRGRPRLYCSERCKINGVKRHQRNAADPLRSERLPDLSKPRWVAKGYAGRRRYGLNHSQLPRERDFDNPDWTARCRQLLEERGIPQPDELRCPWEIKRTQTL